MSTPLSRLEPDAEMARTFQSAEVESIRLAARGRLVAIVLFTSYGVLAFDGGLQANTLLYGAAFGALALTLNFVAGSRFDRPWVIYLIAVLEVALLTDAVLTPNPFNPAPWPQPMVFRYDNFYYFFVLIAVTVFSYSPYLVLWAGLCTALAWGIGVALLASRADIALFADAIEGATSSREMSTSGCSVM